ncbi:MAG TPA: cupin domain-containing protein [Rhizomicrobium sp.]|nr:cupin domain-containing protein [Rhizomicrobium sp.]
MKTHKRPDFIMHWSAIEGPAGPPGGAEDFGFASELSAAAGINHLRAAHLRVPPGLRGYPPLAMQDDEVFSFVLEGTPDLWVDGHLYRLREGDGIALAAGTGIAHAILNNTARDVRIFVMTEAFRRNSRIFHARDAAANETVAKMDMLWADPPRRKLGPNDGRPGSREGARRGRPNFVVHWRDILKKDEGGYPNSPERHGIDAPFGRQAGFSRIGVHLEILKPGRRTSWPHAERDEDEFVYVVSGRVDAWNDGRITPMGEGDFIGWRAKTGITHVVINNGEEDAVLLVGGEASRSRARIWYPLHPHRDRETGEAFWADHPRRALGPHDGLPDRLRALLPKAALRTAVAANTAAFRLDRRRAAAISKR